MIIDKEAAGKLLEDYQKSVQAEGELIKATAALAKSNASMDKVFALTMEMMALHDKNMQMLDDLQEFRLDK